MLYVIAAIFTVGAVASLLAVITARRGAVTHSDGYPVPSHVSSDPDLRRRANEIVAWWGALVSGLCVVPVACIGWLVASDAEELMTTPMLIFFGIYGLVTAIAGAYPFERIKRL